MDVSESLFLLVFYRGNKKEILGAEKVYVCTICDCKRNYSHFQLFPRLKGDTIGYQNFAIDEGILLDYKETAELYRIKLKNILG